MASGPSTNGFSGSPEEFVRGLWPAAESRRTRAWRRPAPHSCAGRSRNRMGPRGSLACNRKARATISSASSPARAGTARPYPCARWNTKTGCPSRGAITSAHTIRRRIASRITSHCSRTIRVTPRRSTRATNAHAFARALQNGGYATDPAYARKVAAIAQNLPASNPSLKSADLRPIAARNGPF